MSGCLYRGTMVKEAMLVSLLGGQMRMYCFRHRTITLSLVLSPCVAGGAGQRMSSGCSAVGDNGTAQHTHLGPMLLKLLVEAGDDIGITGGVGQDR